MNQSARRVWGSGIVVSTLALAGLGCSDDDGDDGKGGAGGSSAQGGSGGLGGTDETPVCRGEPADVAATFASLAGDYTFTTDVACDVGGVSFAKDVPHRTVVDGGAQRIDVIPTGAAAGLSYAWDGARDLACKSDFTEYLEIDGYGRFVRLSLLNDEPLVVLFGLCLGNLEK